MKKTIIFASILTFLCHSSVYADTNQTLSISKKSNQISVETIVPDIIDNSNILVEVTLTTSGGESSVIYTGTLQIDKINGQSLIYTYDNMGNLLTKRLRTEGTENE